MLKELLEIIIKRILFFLFLNVFFLKYVIPQDEISNSFRHWKENDGITWTSDTTGQISVGDSVIQIINTDTIHVFWNNSTLTLDTVRQNFIDCQSEEKLVHDFDNDGVNDTIPAASMFSNFDYDSLYYFKFSEPTYLHGFKNKPKRLTEIAIYTTATDVNDYFNVPSIASTGAIFVPDDQATISAAISAATTGDTIYVKSGITNLGTGNISVNKDVTIIFVGSHPIYGRGSYLFVLSNSNAELQNAYGISSGTNAVAMSANPPMNRILSSYFEASTRIFQAFNPNGDLYFEGNIGINGNFVDTKSNTQTRSNYANCNSSIYSIKDSITLISTEDIYRNSLSVITNNTNIDDLIIKNAKIFSDEFIRIPYDFDSIDVRNSIIIPSISVYKGFKQEKQSNFIIDSSVIITDGTTSDILSLLNKNFYFTNNFYEANGTAFNIKLAAEDGYYPYFEIKNNRIYSKNIENGYPIEIGTTSFTNKNRLYGVVEGNEIKGGIFFNDSILPVNHGVSIWHTDSIVIRYNYIDGYILPIVLKGESADYSSVNVYGNIWKNGRLVLRGVENANIYNNLGVINKNIVTSVISTSETQWGFPSLNNKIKNNIFINYVNITPLLYIENLRETLTIDHNLYYNATSEIIIKDTLNSYTLNQWQKKGFDLNSYDQNPQLDEFMIPIINSPVYTINSFKGVKFTHLLNKNTSFPNPNLMDLDTNKFNIGPWVLNYNFQSEPTSYPTSFIAKAKDTANIIVYWTASVGEILPDKYLLYGQQIAERSFKIPQIEDNIAFQDDTNWEDGNYFLNIEHKPGLDSTVIVGLNPETIYSFTLIPYTINDSFIDYKTDGTPPLTSDTTLVISYINMEPSLYPTNLSIILHDSTSATLAFLSSAGERLPENYLIYGVNIAFDKSVPLISDGELYPDDNDWADGSIWKNISHSINECTVKFENLSPSSIYTFYIWPYSGSGNSINYKTDGSVPFVTFTTKEKPTNNSKKSEYNVRLFPNPVENELKLILIDSNANGFYKIITANGRTMQKGIINRPELDIDVSNFKVGLYFIEIIQDSDANYLFFIKN